MIEGKQIEVAGGAVAAEPEASARVGAEILAGGGNAFDALVASCFATSVLCPSKCGLGGYLLSAVAVEGSSGRMWAVDANSRAPSAAHAEMFDILPIQQGRAGTNESEYGCSVKDDANLFGGTSVGVPGQMAGMGTLWERWGRLPWEQLIAPSIALLDEGFAYGDVAASIREREAEIRQVPASTAHLMPDGRLPDRDDQWHRPDTEKALRRLAEAGWRDLYEGDLARAIVATVQADGGRLSIEDMSSYQPRVTEPLSARFRDAEICGAILPNGTLSVMQAMQMLDCLPPVASDEDVRYWHHMAEVMKRVWRDRLQYLGDPDYVDVPIERLLSVEYASGRVEDLIQLPDRVDTSHFPNSGVGMIETSHISAADAEGNVVSATITHGGAFGSCLTVPGWGLILGHGMARLDPVPGRCNSIAGGKRPLNNVATCIVRQPGRDLAVGMPGGRRIISVATQLLSRLVDFDAGPAVAATAPRMHVVAAEPLELQDTVEEHIEQELVALGHTTVRRNRCGGAAHFAEYTHAEGRVRAGGNGWAAGV
ncbi:MAG: gamma-glutamyltransferase [Candidatus Latescibacterota bacterium]|nr:gamma-glutamyltransferase [Candidatus Latescibacterota bacterium]